ncbi:MAG: 3-phosphoshikimate 1-carboxyvinyltransferase [Solirubrobacterales bacterium]
MTAAVRFEPSGPLRGSVVPPADKSISHRAAILGAMASGPTEISNYLVSDDTEATLVAMEALGADVHRRGDDVGDLVVSGVGPTGPTTGVSVDVANSGTLLRLLPGWLAGWEGGRWEIDGDDSIRRRPVDRVAVPLGEMGARIEASGDRFPPLVVEGAELAGIEYTLPVASAQVKSCLLLAGLKAGGPTTIHEPLPTRDHTERMLGLAGVRLDREGSSITVWPTEEFRLDSVEVPGDFSSAAFLMVAALLVPGSEIRLDGVGTNPTRTGLLSILSRMGAEIEVEQGDPSGEEPVGSLVVRHSALTGTDVGGAEIPLAIDELPLVALAAAFADGETVIRDAAELRAKESDRIETVSRALRGLGIEAESTPDGLVVRGGNRPVGGEVDAEGDHRIAMLGAVAGLASRDGIEVTGFEAASVSYPGFERDLAGLTGA